MKIIHSIATITALLVAASPAAAQMTYDMSSNTFSAMPYMPYNPPNVNEIVEQNGSPPSRLNQSSAQQKASDFSFSPSKQLRRQNVANFIGAYKKTDPNAAAQLEAIFARQDIFTAIEMSASQEGIQVNNVSHAFAVWWISAWKLANGDFTESTKSQNRIVIGQSAKALSASPLFVQMTQAQRQEMSDSLWLQTMIMTRASDISKNDRSKLTAFSTDIRKMAREFGMNLDVITLTDQGFVPRKGGRRGDAGEAVDGADPAVQSGQLANTTNSAGAYSGSDLAVLVAAVSAGAGGIFMIGKGLIQKQGWCTAVTP